MLRVKLLDDKDFFYDTFLCSIYTKFKRFNMATFAVKGRVAVFKKDSAKHSWIFLKISIIYG